MERYSVSYRLVIGILAIVLLANVVLFAWTMHWERQQALTDLREKTAVIAGQLVATRQFVADNQDRINYDSRGNFEFKRLNPAAVGRGVGRIFSDMTAYGFKQTRLRPRHPDNAPTPWEQEALRRLEAEPGLREIWGIDTWEGRRVFRYMVPLYMEESCLPCHGPPAGELDISGHPKEGYQLGRFAGAISVFAPSDFYEARWRGVLANHLGFSGLTLILTLSLLYALTTRLATRPLRQLTAMATELGKGNLDVSMDGIQATGEIKVLAEEFATMARRLREVYGDLERKVDERTRQLREVNEVLARHREELSRSNAELARVNRVQSEFLTNVTHELRTPLTAIIAFSEMMLVGSAGPVTEEQREYLKDILDSGQLLLTLINDLLDLARIESGQMHLVLESVDIGEVVRAAERTLRPLAAQRKQELVVSIPSELPPVEADAARLLQVVVNLAGNAVKFTPPAGRVAITVDAAEDRIQVRVTDTGPGIPVDEQERIFDKFTQLDGSSTREHRGTGLGLAIARHLVELHGGRLSVESTPGKGSTFTATIPRWPKLGTMGGRTV